MGMQFPIDTSYALFIIFHSGIIAKAANAEMEEKWTIKN
jgi:hypothetical protein